MKIISTILFTALTSYVQTSFAQENSWHFKSPIDDFRVVSNDGNLTIAGHPLNKRAFDDFLNLLLKPNREDCPTVGAAELTVEAKSGSTVVTKKFYPTEGVFESNGKCNTMDYESGWSLPVHREWFLADPDGHISVGETMTFKSSDINFQVKKKDKEWWTTTKEFFPNLVRIGDFARSAQGFTLEGRFSKKIKSTATRTFTFSTNGKTYGFFHIQGMWMVEVPGSHSLAASKDFSMIGKFAREELRDSHSSNLGLLTDKNAKIEERLQALEDMTDVDSPVFTGTLHKVVKDSQDDITLREKIALIMSGRPTKENIRVLMKLLESGQIKEKAFASKALRKLNPIGPGFTEKDDMTSTSEKEKKWRDWYAKYLQAQK